MDILTKILDSYPDDGYEKVDGFDAAIIGVTSKGQLVYSIDKILEVLVSRNNWTNNYFFYNIEFSYSGDKAPIFIDLIND